MSNLCASEAKFLGAFITHYINSVTIFTFRSHVTSFSRTPFGFLRETNKGLNNVIFILCIVLRSKKSFEQIWRNDHSTSVITTGCWNTVWAFWKFLLQEITKALFTKSMTTFHNNDSIFCFYIIVTWATHECGVLHIIIVPFLTLLDWETKCYLHIICFAEKVVFRSLLIPAILDQHSPS